MREKILAVLLVAAVPLGGCASLPSSLVAPQSIADSEKALAVAHLAYQGAGVALKSAAQSGALHGAAAADAKALYDKAGAALATADAADAAANAPDLIAALGDATALLAQLRALIPPQ